MDYACNSIYSLLILNYLSRRDFEVSYELDVHSLCTDFQEDISFHFSLGWTNLVKKFLAPRNARLAILLGANVSFPISFLYSILNFAKMNYL